MKKAIFYHAGCAVCVEAEQQVLDALDCNRYEVESVHLAQNSLAIEQAQLAGVRSVPALLLDGTVFHINFGASLDEVKGACHA
ncbi:MULTISPECIES: thioredoxin family protein [Pseudoalteromonas]|uniref:Thioredoxin n=1 Tax=Pseudoalteromonas amylolytica TaxID=1859457 RepID=A0A1S1MRT1_9GAMM|nr:MULTISPECIES: thioredoxin family protein [Pseudoalteromonas]OHU84396.1 thioredoxin [Pseudoalteromonas sp. JW3]OHU87064.1 thioredoxin [Pseudoalteromonas amylolytica]